MEQQQNQTPKDPTEGFCPACGEPCKDGKINHDDLCPFKGDDLPPEDACR